jgi:hypothetical protein
MGKKRTTDDIMDDIMMVELALVMLIPLLFFCVLYLPKGYATFPRDFFIGCALIAIPFFLRICRLFDKTLFVLGESFVAISMAYWLVVKIGLLQIWTTFFIFLLITILVLAAFYTERRNEKKGGRYGRINE